MAPVEGTTEVSEVFGCQRSPKAQFEDRGGQSHCRSQSRFVNPKEGSPVLQVIFRESPEFS